MAVSDRSKRRRRRLFTFRDHFTWVLLPVAELSAFLLWSGAGGWEDLVCCVGVGLQTCGNIALAPDVDALILYFFVAPHRHKQLFQLAGRLAAFSGRS